MLYWLAVAVAVVVNLLAAVVAVVFYNSHLSRLLGVFLYPLSLVMVVPPGQRTWREPMEATLPSLDILPWAAVAVEVFLEMVGTVALVVAVAGLLRGRMAPMVLEHLGKVTMAAQDVLLAVALLALVVVAPGELVNKDWMMVLAADMVAEPEDQERLRQFLAMPWVVAVVERATGEIVCRVALVVLVVVARGNLMSILCHRLLERQTQVGVAAVVTNPHLGLRVAPEFLLYNILLLTRQHLQPRAHPLS